MEEQKDGAFAASSENGKKKLVFAVNGERFEVPNPHPSTTLLSFLRSHTLYKSPKLGCGEGGCGACVVLVSKYDPVHSQVEDYTVSACLTLLCSVNGCSITTSEGIGNSRDGFHSIHQRFAGFHASQCGFCTPGMCVSLFSALINADKLHRPEPPQGFSKLTVSEAERAVAGNLCRCTGYRPIADACKSFAADVDIEDLGLNCFWNKEDSREVKVGKLPFYDPGNRICTYPEFLKTAQKHKQKSGILLGSERCHWECPVSLEELQGLLGCDLGENGKRVKLVVGNTGMGYYKDFEEYDRYIDLRYISELSVVKRDWSGIEVGATVTISKLILNLREESEDLGSFGKIVLGKIADHMENVGFGHTHSKKKTKL